MRPEPSALNPANYPFTVDIPTRFGDQDFLGHINNVAVAQLFEESRVRFGLFARAKPLKELQEQSRLVTVATTIHYLAEVFYPTPVTVAVGVKKIGTSSYTLACLMLQEHRPVACSLTTLVRSEDGKSKPLPAQLAAILASYQVKDA